jgi:hypothetical protein
MILKEKGELVNTASERAIKKSWKSFPTDTFKYKDLEFKINVVEDAVAGKDGKKAPAAA